MALERLQKILAHAGVASRRVSEEIIADGRVTIDGKVVTEPGTKADLAQQDVRLDGRHIHAERPEYWLLNKPKGVVCTNLDPAGRPRPIDLMAPYTRARLFPVGRLDADSKGLLLMTNDGEFANLLAHPRYEVPKTYVATVAGRVSGEEIRRLAGGMRLAEGRTRPARVEALKRGHTRSLLEITIREGRNRQIRRMLARLRHPVRELVRTRIGRITLRGVGPGRARPLVPDEVEYLKRLAAEPRPARPAAPPVQGTQGPPPAPSVGRQEPRPDLAGAHGGAHAGPRRGVHGREVAPRGRGRGPTARGERDFRGDRGPRGGRDVRGERGHRGSHRRREGREDRAARGPQGPPPGHRTDPRKRSRHHP